MYIILPLFFAGVLQGCATRQKPRFLMFRETFKKDDKIPFGSYASYNHFRQLFGNRFIQTNEKPFDEAWKDMKEYSTNTKYSLYVAVTKNLVLDYGETEALLSFVKEGNDLFIAADYIDDYLLSQVNCMEERRSGIIAEASGVMRRTKVNTSAGDTETSSGFAYFYYPFLNSFYNFDSANTKVLGVNEIGEPDYLVFFLGTGRLYLHAAPRAFSNYFFLTNDNYKYLERILSYLRPDPKNIFWDEYFKNKYVNRNNAASAFHGRRSRTTGYDEQFSSLNVIQKSPSLLLAFWLSAAAIVVYILFRIKRKQRVINHIAPHSNTTLVFTETVGRLYLQKKDNKNMSEKMITYFYEFTRNRFFLNANQVNEEFKISLSRKSGVGIADTQKLFESIAAMQANKTVTDEEVVLLNNLIEKFYKNRTNGRKVV